MGFWGPCPAWQGIRVGCRRVPSRVGHGSAGPFGHCRSGSRRSATMLRWPLIPLLSKKRRGATYLPWTPLSVEPTLRLKSRLTLYRDGSLRTSEDVSSARSSARPALPSRSQKSPANKGETEREEGCSRTTQAPARGETNPQPKVEVEALERTAGARDSGTGALPDRLEQDRRRSRRDVERVDPSELGNRDQAVAK